MPMTPTQVVNTAEIAFVGKVVSIEEGDFSPQPYCWARTEQKPQCGGKRVTFRVADRIRGKLDSTVTAVAEDACYCLGEYWALGKRYLVVASWGSSSAGDPLVVSNTCRGTMPLTKEAKPFMDVLHGAQR